MRRDGLKKLAALCLVLVFVLALAPVCRAEDNFDTLADWDIRVKVPDGKTAVLKGGEYYIYAEDEGAIPYVMLRAYRYDSAEGFLEEFTEYMRGQYSDLAVTREPAPVTLGDKNGLEVFYTYKVSGYDVTDRRVAVQHGERVYMFASKEVASLGKTVGTMLDEVAADCVFLSAPAATPDVAEETVYSLGYLYTLPDGMPKYFVDISGIETQNVVLHCWFRSSDPTFYTRSYALDLATAEQTGSTVLFHKITDNYGFDRSDWFQKLALRFEGEGLVMEVERDESTLAGGSEDNVLTGTYRMEPVDVGFVYQYRQESGALKYWFDLDKKDIELHALFISGDPEPYETVFTLERASAVQEDDKTLRITRVTDAHGLDVSAWFKTLRLSATEDGIVMEVERDESTLAGGAGDNILTGRYLFTPRAFFRPLSGGPFTAEELARLAQIHYFINTGFYPPEADAVENTGGSFTVHLYENVKLEDFFHTATSAWYTVDAYGVGVNDITGEAVSLLPSAADRID